VELELESLDELAFDFSDLSDFSDFSDDAEEVVDSELLLDPLDDPDELLAASRLSVR
jgi:hypothetical protein